MQTAGIEVKKIRFHALRNVKRSCLMTILMDKAWIVFGGKGKLALNLRLILRSSMVMVSLGL